MSVKAVIFPNTKIKLQSHIIFMKLDKEGLLFDIRNKKAHLLNETASLICRWIKNKKLTINQIAAFLKGQYEISNALNIRKIILCLVNRLYKKGVLELC